MEAGFCFGSNMGKRLQLFRQAKTLLLMDPSVEFIDQSPVYETVPVDVREEYRELQFLNAVLVVESSYTAEEWLPKMKQIERALHRVRTSDRNAPRSIDVDLIFCGKEVVDSDLLQVPHPRWAERRFVVEPLATIRPELILPGTKDTTVREVLAGLSNDDEVQLFSEEW